MPNKQNILSQTTPARIQDVERLGPSAREAEHECARLAARVAALEASSSWRLTAPLRGIMLAGQYARRLAQHTGSWLAEAPAKLAASLWPQESWIPRQPSTTDIGAVLPPPLLPRRVLIVAELSIPQCLRYRVRQKAAVLEAMGFPATIVSWRNASRCREELATHGCVLFYRTPAVPEVVDLAVKAKAAGMTTFFEIDDLVFAVDEYARNSNLRSLPSEERDNLLRGAGLYRDMIRHVDCVVASTQLVADRFSTLGAKKVFVVNNALDAIHMDASERTYPKVVDDTVTIVYGSGTDTHDADFAVAAEPLACVMREHSNVRLVLAGHLRLPASLAEFADRVIRIPMMQVEDYQACLARCDISLAPLEPGPFNDAKSNIKFLEASVLGLPSVCSPAAEFVRVIRDGESGFLASTADEWHRKLSHLVSDPALRQRMGRVAKEDVLREFHPDKMTRRQLEPLLHAAFGGPAANGQAPLKLLVVNVHFAPESFGGATIVAEQLAAELGRMPDTAVSIFTGTHSSAVSQHTLHRYSWKSLPVYAVRLPLPGEFPHDHENPRVARLFAQALDIIQPDVIHFHCVQMMSADLVKVAQSRGVPHVITLHDAWWICERQFMVTANGHYCGQPGVDPFKCVGCTPDPSLTQQRFRQLWDALQGATHLLTPSAAFRDLYVRTGVDPAHISVSKNGVLPTGRPEAERTVAARDGLITFAFLGGRGTHKGYFWLQEIFAGMEESNYRLKLTDLSMIHGHRSIVAAEWKIGGKVEITAPYDQETIDDYFADIDVLLFPSLWKESFGLTVREALLRDVWVISTDCGGPAADLVHGLNAHIVPMGDTEAFRDAIRVVLRDAEGIRSHVNLYKHTIRSFAEQAVETRQILAAAAGEAKCHR